MIDSRVRGTGSFGIPHRIGIPPSWIAVPVALALMQALSVRADESQQVQVGPRAIAMGGAFTAIADDGSAAFWNPAGLARVGHQELFASHADLFKSGIHDNFAGFVLPISLDAAAAADWYHSGFDDGDLGFGENRVDFGWGMRVHRLVHAGANLKYLTRSTSLGGTDLGSGRGWGADFGLLASPLDRLRLGLTLQDAFGTSIKYDDGRSSVIYPRHARLGSAWSFGRWGQAALDLDDRWHLGVEATPIAQVTLRGGTADDRHGHESATWSYGVGLKAGALRVDWARVQHPTLEATDHFALGMEFNFNPAQVRIEKVQLRDLYASLYKTYAHQGIGTAQLRNLQDHPISARFSVFVPGYMDAPSQQEVLLRPRAVQEVRLIAVLHERILAQAGDRPLQVQVLASYQSQRLARREKATGRCVAYAPGAINWGDGMAQAAAYVTQADPAVDAFARAAGRAVVLLGPDPFQNRNISFVAAMVNALQTVGFAYLPDPSNPFSAISETPHAVDTITYPAASLEKKTGDCDDSTVLMAALLENVGVRTRFIDAPGHIFLLVDTGLSERDRAALAVDDALTVVKDDEVWIPLETTAISKGFAAAWRSGAEEWVSWSARAELGTVDVEEAQSRFEPAVPPLTRRPQSLDEAALGAAIRRDAVEVSRWRDALLASRFGDAAKQMSVSAAALDQVAHAYYMAGRFDEARPRLEQALEHAPQSARAHNNLALALAAAGDLAGALGHVRTALLAEPGDAGLWLNHGILGIALGDTVAGREALVRGVSLAAGYAAACGLLSIEAEGVDEQSGTGGLSVTDLRHWLKAAAESASRRIEGAPGAPMLLRSRVKFMSNEALVGGGRKIDKYLYWKD